MALDVSVGETATVEWLPGERVLARPASLLGTTTGETTSRADASAGTFERRGGPNDALAATALGNAL